MHIVDQFKTGGHYYRSPAASVDLGAQPGLSRPVRPRNGKRGHRVQRLPPYGALSQDCRERRIAGSTVDEFGRGAGPIITLRDV